MSTYDPSVPCKKCGNKVPASQLKMDIDEGKMICPECIKNKVIHKEIQKEVFSPFFTNKAQGTGLGLAFSRQVVESHGGEIFFESSKTQGTKFTLKMPVIR